MKFSELWRYEKLFWRGVWLDTSKAIRDNLRIEVIVAVTVFGAQILLGQKEPMDSLVATLIAVAVLGVLLVIKNMVVIPAAIHRDQLGTIAAMAGANKKLEDDAKPRLEFIFEPGMEPFEHTEPALATDKAIRLFRIAVKGAGNAFLAHCSVKLCEMTNTTNVYLPVELKQRNDNPRTRQISGPPVTRVRMDDFKQIFAIKPGDLEFFDVVRLDERSEVSEIELCYARSPYDVPNRVPRGCYFLTIRAFAEIGGGVEAKFAIAINDGILKFYRI